MKKADIWGQCPYRCYMVKIRHSKIKEWCYGCNYTGGECDPNYCLGPDEDGKEKDDEN